jgi:hypothetical protein
MARRARYKPYDQPTGGWGSVKLLAEHAIRQQAIGTGPRLMRDHNKPGGYARTSCAWAKPGEPHLAEFCENGAKATFWDLTRKRTTPDWILRSMSGFEVIDYDIPAGSCAAYFPECNAQLLLWHYAQESMTPAAKSIPIRISAE